MFALVVVQRSLKRCPLNERCVEKNVLNRELVRDFVKLPTGPKIANAIDKFGVKWDIVIC